MKETKIDILLSNEIRTQEIGFILIAFSELHDFLLKSNDKNKLELMCVTKSSPYRVTIKTKEKPFIRICEIIDNSESKADHNSENSIIDSNTLFFKVVNSLYQMPVNELEEIRKKGFEINEIIKIIKDRIDMYSEINELSLGRKEIFHYMTSLSNYLLKAKEENKIEKIEIVR